MLMITYGCVVVFFIGREDRNGSTDGKKDGDIKFLGTCEEALQMKGI